MIRCGWVSDDPIYIKYHDEEWGIPNYDDRHLFEMLCLEGQQAGLSWITVLKKREHYRKVLDNFDPQIIASYSDEYLEQLLKDSGIIRNRLKVYGIRKNAKAYLRLTESGESFSSYIWSFVGGSPINNHFQSLKEIPAETELSKAMSKQLKKDGFTFVGSTICYAFMQACGMVNDHTTDCFRYKR